MQRQQTDIFDVLGLDRNTAFKEVKKAYLNKALAVHPDKNPGKDGAEFQILHEAWEKFLAVHKEQQDHEGSMQQGPIQKDSVTIFMPVPFLPNNDWFAKLDRNTQEGFQKTHVLLDRIDNNAPLFMQKFDVQSVSRVITQRISRYGCQVGVTFDEAVAIVDQHSHRALMLIVALRVSLQALSAERQSEAQVNPANLAAKHSPYFWIMRGVLVTADRILSIAPMMTYGNSLRLGSQFKEDERQPLPSPSAIVSFTSTLSLSTVASNTVVQPVHVGDQRIAPLIVPYWPLGFVWQPRLLREHAPICRMIDGFIASRESMLAEPSGSVIQREITVYEDLRSRLRANPTQSANAIIFNWKESVLVIPSRRFIWFSETSIRVKAVINQRGNAMCQELGLLFAMGDQQEAEVSTKALPSSAAQEKEKPLPLPAPGR